MTCCDFEASSSEMSKEERYLLCTWFLLLLKIFQKLMHNFTHINLAHVYLLEWSKCQGTLKRNVASLSTWNWNKITKLKKYQMAAFSTCFCPCPYLNQAMKNLLPMHSLGPPTQLNKCSFFFTFSSKSLVSKLVLHQLLCLYPSGHTCIVLFSG